MIYPKITIVTPSYNQGAFIEKTIHSVLDQSYPNLEYIIIDGGSTDNSISIIKKYEKHLSYWVSEVDKGQSHAINKGLNRASGDLLGWLNSDDYYVGGALHKLAKAYKEDTSVGVVYGRGLIQDEKGRKVYEPVLTEVTVQSLCEWCYSNDFMQPSTLFTKEAWAECGPLDEEIHIAMDVDFWLKVRKKYKFKMVDAMLSCSLSHEGAKTTALRNQMFVDTALVVSKHGGEVAARKMLDEMADKLTECQKFRDYFSRNIFLKIIRRYISWRM